MGGIVTEGQNENAINKIITNKESESIPYPVVFVDASALNMNNVGSCADNIDNTSIYQCIYDNFNVNTSILQFPKGEDNVLDYVSTENAYQAVQYFDPMGETCDDDMMWVYLHGHPAVAYAPSDETNHFPPGNNPSIFTNEEIVVSNSDENIGCYQYRMYTFSRGYYNYYFASRLDLEDPIRSNLRDDLGEVVIGGFGTMSGETITFEVTD